jgi:hypothetical protein
MTALSCMALPAFGYAMPNRYSNSTLEIFEKIEKYTNENHSHLS